MHFDPNNKIVKLCAQGIEMEGKGLPVEAADLYRQAWSEAENDFEKFTAAHYLARHQESPAGKLKWDETALQFALKLNETDIKPSLPSLYLNIGKCHEDLQDFFNARRNYDLASSLAQFLPDNPYGKMIRTGIANGLSRLNISHP